MAIGVVQLHIERFQPAQHRQTYTASGYRAHSHTFHVIRTRHAIPDVPTALHHPLIRGDVIAHERKDHHHHVLGDADAVAVGHLGSMFRSSWVFRALSTMIKLTPRSLRWLGVPRTIQQTHIFEWGKRRTINVPDSRIVE